MTTASASTGSVGAVAVRLARHWWRQLTALAAACGVVAATITGAVGVGDGVSRGLASLALARLGRIDAAVVGEEWFTAALAERMAASVGPAVRLVPAVVIEVAVETVGGGGRRRTVRATLLACDETAALGFVPPPVALEADAMAVNQPLAAALELRAGDPVVVRVAARSDVPADSPLGRRTAAATGRRLRVAQVLPRDGIGQFALAPAQVTGPLVVVSRASVQSLFRAGDVANTIFAIPLGSSSTGEPIAARLRQALAPALDDYGLVFEPAAADAGAPLRLGSRRLILPPEVDQAAADVLAPLGGRPSLVFLANSIAARADRDGQAVSVPYSTILGIDSTELPSGALVGVGGPLPLPGPNELIIDQWLADDLAAQGRPIAPGQPLDVRFFLPETVHGRIEETGCTLRVSGIAAMQDLAVARDLVPDVEGVSDEKSIADWDPPFPFDAARVRTTPPHDEDDRYWKEFGTTPKAFVSLETARRLTGSRFGMSTAWHVPPLPADEVASARRRLAATIRPESMGLRVAALRAEAITAARGSTPFGGLFLALSSFVLVAGLLLEWLLVRLLVAARRRDVGTLAAIGWPPRRIALLLSLVGGIPALLGVAVGSLLGPTWATVLLAALSSSWNAAVAAGSAQVFGAAAPSPWTVLPGAVASAGVSLVALWWAARQAARIAPLRLLRGADEPGRLRGAGRLATALAIGSIAVALGAGCLARAADPRQAVPLFFLAAVASLTGLLLFVWRWLARVGGGGAAAVASLAGLASRWIAERPARAFAVVALVAIAEFLIVAVSSFALAPRIDPHDRRGPTGGWTHIATFGADNGIDPSDPAQRGSLGLSTDAEATLAGCTIARLRSNAGSDASCTNLYAANRPTVLGVGPAFVTRGGFRFAAHAPLPSGVVNPWTLLEADRAAGDVATIPCILDQATAQWALRLGGVGDTFTLPDDAGEPATLEIVGLLEPGILQGSVIVAERQFERLFPRRSGYALALVEAPDAWRAAAPGEDQVAMAVAAAWADAAVTVQTAAARFTSLSAVQNTFLAGFQSLGTLGLLLGTAGLAAVQMQNVLERRGHFAVLRAIGFPDGRIRRIVVVETLSLVGIGLAVGAAAGVVAVIPSLVSAAAALPVGWIAASCGLTLAVALAAGIAAARRTTQFSVRDAWDAA